jgi:two-component sensor histidine kinase/ABC-type amino acid transport substrate-binding protein
MTGSRLRIVLFVLCQLALAEGGVATSADTVFSVPTARSEISVVCDENYPPYAFRDESGKLIGIVPDQWAEWSKATGLRVRLAGLPWAEALRAFDSGEADVLDTVFETPERDRSYDFTPSYARIEVPIFIHSTISGIRSVADLRGFRVSVKEGDSAIEQLSALGIGYIEKYPDYASIVDSARRLDTRVFCVDKPPAIYYLYKYGLDRDFRIAFKLKDGAFRRAVHKGSGPLLGLVERGFSGVPASAYERIDREWLGAPLAKRVGLRVVGSVIGALVALVLALTGIAWMQRRRVAAATAELRAKIGLLEQSEAKNRAFIAARPDLLFILDRDGRYLDYAASDPSLLAYPPKTFIGRTTRELGLPPSVVEAFEGGIGETLSSGRMAAIQYQLEIGGGTKVFECRIVPLASDRVLAIARDVTEQRLQAERLAKSLAEKDVLLKEVHHRVKNNMQMISSLLSLQAKSFRDGEDRRLLAEAQQRIQSFARLHELVYDSPDLASIGLIEYLEALARELSLGYGSAAIEVRGPRGVRVLIDDAVPLGLVANELMTNALKYGRAEGGEDGRILASVSLEGGELRFSIEDGGPGLPPGVDPGTTDSMGFLLLRSLAAQLRGRISFSGPPGLRVLLSFPFGGSGDETR